MISRLESYENTGNIEGLKEASEIRKFQTSRFQIGGKGGSDEKIEGNVTSNLVHLGTPSGCFRSKKKVFTY